MSGRIFNGGVYFSPSFVDVMLTELDVESLFEELNSISLETLHDATTKEILERAPRFALFFDQLRTLIADNVLSQQSAETQSTAFLATSDPLPSNSMTPLSVPSSSSLLTQSRKRPNSLTIDTSSPAKVRPKSPQTPDQPTIPKDPTFTSDSIESSDEDNTKHMIVTFVRTILLHLPDLTEISWPSTAKRCKLSMSGYLNISETVLMN